MEARRAKPGRPSRTNGKEDLLKRLRQAERRLREIEERHELVMGAVNEGVYDWNIALGTIYYSERVHTYLGLPQEVLKTPQDWAERVHPDDLAHYRAAHVAHFKGQTARFECDYRYRGADGAWRWARTHGVALRDRNGRAYRMVGSTGDITELKERERELAEQKEILETTLENIDQGITMVDRNLRTIALNRRFLELLEFPPERFARGFHMEEAFRFNAERGEYGPGEVEEQVRQRIELSCRFEPHAFERSRPNGKVIAVRGTPLPGGAGFVSTYSDVTEQRRAEERLRKSEERYALATSAAVEGIYEWDVATSKLFLTERAKAFFAFPAGDLTPAAWNQRIHADDFPGYVAAIIDHFKGRTPHIEHEYRIADAQGDYKWVLERGIGVRDANGRVIKVVGALSNITRRKRAEHKLRRARDQAEKALEQQTATAEILKATLASPTDVGQVFQAIVTSASRLCEASFAAVFLYDGEVLRNVAQQNASAQFAQALQRMRARPSRETTTRRCALERRTIHTADLLNDPEYSPPEPQRRENVRTALSVPMMREGVLFGVITLWRGEVKPFTDRQVALVQTFADQAVIAIENVRLFNETKDALERQTATAEILKVISSSPTDTQPVFDAIVQGGLKLFSGAAISVALPDGDKVRAAAVAESDPGRAAAWRDRFPFPLTREYMHGAAILDRRVVDVPDVAEAPGEWAVGGRNFLASGYRAITIMPMMRGEDAIGALSVVRLAPGPLSDKQLAVLKTFADQAVIAIENVRLLNETKEALEQQKASAEVLGAISSSIADTKPVFDKILESCQRLFAGRIVGLNLVGEDGLVRIGAYHGSHREEFERIFPLPLDRSSGSGQAIVDGRVVHYPDTEGGDDVPAATRQGCKAIGIKSAIFAPILWEGQGMGAIFVGREHVSSFSDKEITLLRTFADQAAIAIQNARLFNEIEEKSRQLEAANRHKSEFLANMSHELRTPLNAIIGFTRIVMRRSQEHLEPKQYENLEKILASGQHLLLLINAILDLAKVEAGRIEVNAGEIELARVLEQCLRTVEPLLKTDGVALVSDFDGSLPQMYVDEEKLRQIVINLLSNAAKFTSRGSIRLQAQAANGSVWIAVADTGIGIPADKLGLIFEEFEQADASSTRVYGGTGLGLTIARRLARLMGGDISAASTPGSGSTFTLRLPARFQA